MRPALIGVALALAAPAALAQMGSPGGGEAQAVALHPSDPLTIYVGAARGLCKTTSGGKDGWPSTGLEALSPRAIALDRANPDMLYAGTYEMGVYRSTDAGRTWSKASAGISNLRIRGLVIDPSDGRVVYAGTDGGGVYKSVDGGTTWREVNRGLIDKTLRCLVGDPDDSATLYAGTWHGIYRTTDAGQTWQANPDGLYDIDVRAIAINPADPQVVYAATDPGGVHRSADGGWTWLSSKTPLLQRILALTVDPAEPDRVFAGTTKGVFRSDDRGRTFRRAGLQWSNRTWALVFDSKTAPPTLYYAGEGGVLKTTDGGRWWELTGPRRR